MSGISAGQMFYLQEMIQVKPGQIASRKLSLPDIPDTARTGQEWVLYAMDEEETISSETSPSTKFIYVLEGTLRMVVDVQDCSLTAGGAVLVPRNTWHAYAAGSKCKFLQISL
ncbi:cupin domain-containing protein [Paenibacillus sp. FSL M7-1046]|uniref:cupin domain-containing protein n=1 Tax=Paenibacillus sp. FSL M7-1046 TaxID=2975315 RepID=UPI0030F6EA33